jgi:type II secretory pathway pseudopilin PulG
MAALLVAMSVMAVVLTVALPVYTTAARREKETELIFRGEQYARAIAMFQRKYGNAIPPNLDVLLNEKFLRKKYKDPITGEDFQLLSPGTPIPGQDTPPQTGTGAQQAGRSAGPQSGGGRAGATPTRTPTATPLSGSVIGVVSKSTERSLRLYNGRDRYNEWVFLGTQQSNRAGTGARGGAVPGGRGGRAGPQPAVPGARGQRLTLPGRDGGRGPSPFGPSPGPGGRRGQPLPPGR